MHCSLLTDLKTFTLEEDESLQLVHDQNSESVDQASISYQVWSALWNLTVLMGILLTFRYNILTRMEDVSTWLLQCLCPSDQSVTDGDERHVTFAEYGEANDGTSKY